MDDLRASALADRSRRVGIGEQVAHRRGAVARRRGRNRRGRSPRRRPATRRRAAPSPSPRAPCSGRRARAAAVRRTTSAAASQRRTSSTAPVTVTPACRASACTARGRRAADDREARIRMARADRWQRVAREIGHRIDIGAIIHLPGEDDQRPRRLRPAARNRPRDRSDACRCRSRSRSPRADRRNSSASAALTNRLAPARAGDLAFERGEQACLAPHQPAHRAACVVGKGGELGRIDVDEIHDTSGARRTILRHLAGEDVGRRSPRVRTSTAACDRRVGEGGERHGAAGRQRFGERHASAAWCGARLRSSPAGRRNSRRRIAVGGSSAKATRWTRARRARCFSMWKRPDLVAAIGRERHAVGEEQDVAHQPSPRDDPRADAVGDPSGSRFQVAIIAAYLGLSGLTSRGGAVAAAGIEKRLRLEAPVPLERRRAGAGLRTAEVEARAAARAGMAHQREIHPVVGAQRPRRRGAAAPIGIDRSVDNRG